jgi:hypothetical protein
MAVRPVQDPDLQPSGTGGAVGTEPLTGQTGLSTMPKAAATDVAENASGALAGGPGPRYRMKKENL